ncbi:agmatinase [Dehalococcoidales bacterium]|nr:agmatinase [Dehalococcoidales bacterium]
MKELFSPPRNFAGISSPHSDWEKARVVVLPVPYDSTTSWRSGARDGPQAIIDASQYLGLYDLELDREIYQVGIHTLPEIEPEMTSPEQMIERVYTVAREVLDKNKLLLMLGGEHSLTLGTVKAYRERYEALSVLQLDAHADLRDSYLGTKFSHASVMRRVCELCPIVPVGIRSLSQEEHKFIDETGIKPFYAKDLISAEDYIKRIIASLSDQVYITIDLDVLDPSIMSAVGTPEPGGIGWYELLTLLGEVAQSRQIVGFDLVELCPGQGPLACAFVAAKLAYKLIGYIFYQNLVVENG